MKQDAGNGKQDMVFGKRPVLEAMKQEGLVVNKIWISENFNDVPAKNKVISYAKEKKIPYFIVPSNKLNSLTDNQNHQGLLLSISPIEYLSIDELIQNIHSWKGGRKILASIRETEGFGE